MGLETADPPLLPFPDAALPVADRLHFLDLYGMAAGPAALTLTATPGSYAVTGTSATLTKAGAGARILTATPGSYALIGTAATLTKTGAVIEHVTLTATPGLYLYSGTSAGLTYSAEVLVYRYAGADLDGLPTPYAGRLINSAALTLVRELADPLWNANPAQGCTLELANVDGALTPWYLADPHGRRVAVARYDVRSGFLLTRFTGLITWPRLGEHTVEVECAALDDALYTEQVPEPVIEVTDFPRAIEADVDRTIPVIFGQVPSLPLPFVNDDRVGSLFDYLVGHGTLAITALARNVPGSDKSLFKSIQFSECVRQAGGPATTWAEVARTDLYPGYTAVRFILRQGINAHADGGLHTIYADVTGPARNFARATRLLLAHPTWGLGAETDPVTFGAAEAHLASFGVSHRSTVLALTPACYYRFEEPSGTTLTDASGNARHGTYSGTPGFGAPPAPIGGVDQGAAVTFPGLTSTFATVASPVADAVNNATALSWSCWYQVPALGITATLFEKTIAGLVDKQLVCLQTNALGGNKILWRLIKGGTPVDTTLELTATDIGQWHHVVGLYNNGEMLLYMNGVLSGRGTYAAGPIDLGAGALTIGARPGGVFPMRSALDELAFFPGVVLSPAQVGDLYAAGGFLCDGAMVDARKAHEVLTDLLLVRGMRLGMNADGAITLTVDQPRNTVALDIGDDPGDGPRNIAAPVAARQRTPPEDRVRRVVLRYRYDYARISAEDAWRGRVRRQVNPTGKKREIPHAFIRDATTADAVVDYLAERIYAGQDTIEVTVTQEGRAVEVGDLVTLTRARQGYNGDVLEVQKIEERLTSLALTLRGYSWRAFAYTPGTLPGDPVDGGTGDLSRTLPSPGTLTFLSSATNVGDDGHVLARLRYDVTLPASNISVAHLLYKIAGNLEWSIAAILTPDATRGRLNSLLPGTAYDVGLQVIGAYPTNVSAIVTDLARVTPTDSTVPGTPSAPVVSSPKPGSHVIIDVSSTPLDWAYTIFWRDINSVFAGAVEVGRAKTRWFLDQTGAYNTQYWFFLQHVDQSGNASPASAGGSSGAGGAPKVQGSGGAGGGDIDTGPTTGVATPNIVANAATAPAVAAFTAISGNGTSGELVIPGASVTVTTQGGPIMILASVPSTIQTGTNQYVQLLVRLYRGGTLLNQWRMSHTLAVGEIAQGSVAIVHVDTSGAGTYTFALSVSVAGSVSNINATYTVDPGILQAVEFKR